MGTPEMVANTAGNASGRCWKAKKTERHSAASNRVAGVGKTWAEKEVEREVKRKTKEYEKAVKAADHKEKREKREETERRAKMKEENTKKSETFQVVTNVAKIKKMSRAQRKLITKADTTVVDRSKKGRDEKEADEKERLNGVKKHRQSSQQRMWGGKSSGKKPAASRDAAVSAIKAATRRT